MTTHVLKITTNQLLQFKSYAISLKSGPSLSGMAWCDPSEWHGEILPWGRLEKQTIFCLNHWHLSYKQWCGAWRARHNCLDEPAFSDHFLCLYPVNKEQLGLTNTSLHRNNTWWWPSERLAARSDEALGPIGPIEADSPGLCVWMALKNSSIWMLASMPLGVKMTLVWLFLNLKEVKT